jgi:hypothetical protein
VPVDVAVEEPGTGIVGEEPNRDVITGVADAHHIPDNRIDKVVRGVAGAADDIEGMSMQVNRVLYRRAMRVKVMAPTSPKGHNMMNTHRSANGTTGNGEFNALIRLEAVDTTRGQQLRRGLSTAQYLKQHRNSRGLEINAIDEECSACIVLNFLG